MVRERQVGRKNPLAGSGCVGVTQVLLSNTDMTSAPQGEPKVANKELGRETQAFTEQQKRVTSLQMTAEKRYFMTKMGSKDEIGLDDVDSVGR
ncbi:hypothetical protein NDU88_002111 [Pleurodeles waltl]|uniref:Uncharacterized protein n=1 Tax=Pleurodeles waltl TaxID=8319 RepID=A0AAV7KTR8_PLEWA|nr:hypothetical protein NDU88_002111 [Pleurodeles waltl]